MSASAPVDTRGWDTVSVVRVDAVNAAIEKAGTTPPGFRNPALENGQPVVVSGAFDPWSILNGGDGHQLVMTMPVRDLIIEVGEVPKTFAKARATVLVQLELLPTDTEPVPGVREHLLVVAAPTAEKTIAVTDSEIEGSAGLADQSRFEEGLETWLNDHIRQFMHVFAAVTLQDAIEQTEAYVWMRPTHSTYAFGRHPSDQNASVLGILSQTGGRDASGLSIQIEPDDIPVGANTAFLISQDRFITDMIADGLPLAYEGLKRSQLHVDLNDRKITLINGETPTIKTIDHDGKNYEVQLTMLEIVVHDDKIAVTSETRTKIVFGAWSVCVASATYGFGLTTNKAGEQTIGFFEIDSQEPEHRTEIDKGTLDVKKVLLIVAGIIVVIGVVIAGAVWLGIISVGAVTAAAILGFAFKAAGVTVAMAMITWAIEKLQKNDAPAFDLTLSNPASAVKWCAGGSFMPRSAELAGAFRIAGILAEDPVINLKRATAKVEDHTALAFQQRYAAFMQKRAA